MPALKLQAELEELRTRVGELEVQLGALRESLRDGSSCDPIPIPPFPRVLRQLGYKPPLQKGDGCGEDTSSD